MELREKLMHIQNELKCPKDQFNSFGKYHYRSTESIMEAVKPLALKYKSIVTVTDELQQIGDRYYILAIATIHDVESDKSMQATAYAREPETKKGMDSSQITGSTSSYARKYALNGLFAIDDTKDSDATNTHVKQATEPVQGKQLDQYGNSDLITEKQRKLLYARTKEKGIGEDAVKLLLGNYGYESSKDIKRNDFNKILEDLDKAK